MEKKIDNYNFKDFLQERGLKMTWERNIILGEVLGRAGHFQADDLIRFFDSSEHRISRATVYRTLKLLEDAGIIKSFQGSEEIRIYEKVKKHHDHLICIECGKIIEFYNPEIEKLQKSVCSSADFVPVYHVMNIYGLCDECSKS